MTTPTLRKPGFRFSPADAGVIVVGALLTWLSWRFLGSFSLIFPIVLFHFFLFCNVFRIRRKYELIWAAVFIINVLLWSLSGRFNWWMILMTQVPVTCAAIVLEIRNDRYHGIGYTLKHRARADSETSS